LSATGSGRRYGAHNDSTSRCRSARRDGDDVRTRSCSLCGVFGEKVSHCATQHAEKLCGVVAASLATPDCTAAESRQTRSSDRKFEGLSGTIRNAHAGFNASTRITCQKCVCILLSAPIRDLSSETVAKVSLPVASWGGLTVAWPPWPGWVECGRRCHHKARQRRVRVAGALTGGPGPPASDSDSGPSSESTRLPVRGPSGLKLSSDGAVQAAIYKKQAERLREVPAPTVRGGVGPPGSFRSLQFEVQHAAPNTASTVRPLQKAVGKVHSPGNGRK